MSVRRERSVIIGYDVMTCLGSDVGTTWQRACVGASGIGPITRFPLRRDAPVTIAGEMCEPSYGEDGMMSRRALKQWASPVIRSAMCVVQRALGHAGLAITPSLAPRVATTFSTAMGGLDQFIAADRALVARDALPHPFVNPNACINMVGGKVAMLIGATGPSFCPVGACASGNISLAMGDLLIRTGLADVAVCGAADVSLLEVILAGFATMNGIFTPKDESDRGHADPTRASRPFSADRRGFVASEGAAAVILARPSFVRAHGLRARAELAGWAMTTDAHHAVAPHGPTTLACMRDAVADAGIAPRDIQAVNAHAASTKVGDLVEAQGLHSLFDSAVPAVTANKSQFGHAMGAASAIEAVLAVLCLTEQKLLPTLNHQGDPAIPLTSVVTTPTSLSHEFVLSNAFGFGGHNCALVLRGIEQR